MTEAPEELLANLQLIECRARLGTITTREEETIGRLTGADVTDEGLGGAWMRAAFALEQAGYTEQARRLYESMLESPRISAALQANAEFRFGLVLEKLSQWKAAEAAYRAAILIPDFPGAQKGAALALANLQYAREEYEAAGDLYLWLQEGPGLSPGEKLFALLRGGLCLMRVGQPDRAREALERCRGEAALQRVPLEIEAELRLAELHEATGDLQAARSCYQRIITNPSSEPHLRAAALMRMRQFRG